MHIQGRLYLHAKPIASSHRASGLLVYTRTCSFVCFGDLVEPLALLQIHPSDTANLVLIRVECTADGAEVWDLCGGQGCAMPDWHACGTESFQIVESSSKEPVVKAQVARRSQIWPSTRVGNFVAT